MFSSPLQRAIKRGLAPGGDLHEELHKLNNYQASSRKDAQAICTALKQVFNSLPSDAALSSLHPLTALFQNAESTDCPAFPILRDEGIRLLLSIYDKILTTESADDRSSDLLFILKILALYGTPEGVERVIAAARLPLHPDDYMWSIILRCFGDGHPERDTVLSALSNPFPPDFIAVALLDAANSECVAGRLDQHPFDSPQGIDLLRGWLTNGDPEKFSYARSTATALPFVAPKVASELLGLAREHADPDVCIEAAWASARAGQKIGFDILAERCLDYRCAATAVSYLKELEREDLVPPQSLTPEFAAKTEFAQWLSHPNELGQPPDELEIIDDRSIYWPPAGEVVHLFLIKYLLHDTTNLEADDVDCGLVGHMTWCFFDRNMIQRPPEDIYAIHCSWELKYEQLINRVESGLDDYRSLLTQWTGATPQSIDLTEAWELSHKLSTDRRLVGVAEARLDDQSGWIVLDGITSAWYLQSDFPDQTGGTMLSIHLGRRLLGFDVQPDRQHYLANKPPEPAPETFLAAFEQLLQEMRTGDEERRKSLLVGWRAPLTKKLFDQYVAVKASQSLDRPTAILIRLYDEILAAVECLDEDSRPEALDSLGVMGGCFQSYVEALRDEGQREKIGDRIALFEPHWDHNLGYGLLGTAAFAAADYATAERLLSKLKDSHEHWERSATMGLLAEIWHHTDRPGEAQELLIHCLLKVRDLARNATGSDRKLHEDEFQEHRKTFLFLFPENADALDQAGIPASAIT